jgi:hypothetical protein
MNPLIKDLQTPKNSLIEFSQLTQRVLAHIENVITGNKEIKEYTIYSSSSAGTTRFTRPVNKNLFLTKKSPHNNYIFPFSRFIINDVWKLIKRE